MAHRGRILIMSAFVMIGMASAAAATPATSAPGSNGNPPQSWQAAVGIGTIITALERF